MTKTLEVGANVRVTQEYVNSVSERYKDEARKLVGQEGVARELRNDVWAVDFDMVVSPPGLNWLFYERELEAI